MTGKHQFFMDTKGHCFLCLQKLTPAPMSASDDEDVGLLHEMKFIPNIFSFQNVCRYLNTNLKEVLGDGRTTDTMSSPSDSLPKSEVTGTMCERCAQLNELFSEHFLELEVIQMKLQSYLKSICDRMVDVEKNKEGVLEVFTKEMSGQPETELQHGIVERLRKTTIDQCFKLTGKLNPLVVLQNIDHLVPDPSNTPEAFAVTKQEPMEAESDTESQLEGGYADHGPLESSSIEGVPQEPTTDETKKYYSINPDTGMFLCNFCPKESKTRLEMRTHYKGVHLGIHYKCRHCEREFYLQGDLRLHQQIVHLGARFCKSIFNPRAIKKKNYLGPVRSKTKKGPAFNTSAVTSSVINSKPEPNNGNSTSGTPAPAVKSKSLPFKSNCDRLVDQKRSNSGTSKFQCEFCLHVFLLNSSRHTHMRTCSKRLQHDKELKRTNPCLLTTRTINSADNLLGTFILPHGDPAEAVKNECEDQEEVDVEIVKMEEEEIT